MRVKLVIIVIIVFHSASLFSNEYKPGYENSTKAFKQWYLEDFRFGGGVGFGFYLTNQMDYQITTNYGNFKEIIPSYFGGIYKVINNDFEVGIQFKQGHLLTLKSLNTRGSTCDFNEVQFMINYSLNHNVGLTQSKYTINAQLGLGATQFRSKYFTVNPATKDIDVIISSAGYEGSLVTFKDQANKQVAVIGNFGLVLGYRLFKGVSIYWENTVNISTSNKMSGNLYKKSLIPPDSYFFSGIGIYINTSPKRGKLGCPKF
jgi:hypothetical protein